MCYNEGEVAREALGVNAEPVRVGEGGGVIGVVGGKCRQEV